MTTATRYICAQMARPLFATLGIALGVLLIERALRILDLVLGWRGGMALALKMVVLLVPHFVGLALPVAVFLAICLTFGRMYRDKELDGFLAAGIGLHQLARPLFAVGGAACLITALVVGYLQPHARYAYNLAVHTLITSSVYALVREQTFTTVGDTTLTVQGVPERGELEAVFIFEDHGKGRSTVTTARRGTFAPTGEPGRTALRLEDGVRQSTEDPLLPQATGRPSSISLRFGEFRTTIEGEVPGSFRGRGGNERELTLHELWGARGPPLEGVRPLEVRAELHGRLAHILTIPVLPLLGVPLALGRRRGARSTGLVTGLIVLIVYNQVLQLGESAAEEGLIPVWLGLWVPFAALTLGAAALFHRAAFHLPRRDWGELVEPALDRALGRIRRLVPAWAYRT